MSRNLKIRKLKSIKAKTNEEAELWSRKLLSKGFLPSNVVVDIIGVVVFPRDQRHLVQIKTKDQKCLIPIKQLLII